MADPTPQNPLLAGTTDGALLIGARGWEHPQWLGTLYPEDLPEEWRLGYYANEFSTVLVPAEAWRGLDCAELTEWAEEVEEGFRFVLESDGTCGAALASALDALGDKLGGWIEHDALWRPGHTVTATVAGLLPAGPHSPRALREMIEPFAAQAPVATRYLFLEGAPDGESLHALSTLRDLMGL